MESMQFQTFGYAQHLTLKKSMTAAPLLKGTKNSCAIESILTFGITTWHVNCIAACGENHLDFFDPIQNSYKFTEILIYA